MKTIYLGMYDHEIGDEDCGLCWTGYPQECECGGLIHAEMLDSDYNNVYLVTKCDKCGKAEDN